MYYYCKVLPMKLCPATSDVHCIILHIPVSRFQLYSHAWFISNMLQYLQFISFHNWWVTWQWSHIDVIFCCNLSAVIIIIYICYNYTSDVEPSVCFCFVLFFAEKAAPVFSITYCPEWNSMPITWRTWLKSEPRPTSKRNGKPKIFFTKSFHSKKRVV